MGNVLKGRESYESDLRVELEARIASLRHMLILIEKSLTVFPVLPTFMTRQHSSQHEKKKKATIATKNAVH